MTEQNKEYFPGGWVRHTLTQSMVYIPSGNYAPFERLELDKTEGALSIPMFAYEQLLKYIGEHETGVLKTDRAEDLKLINRLIDVLEKK